MWARPRHSWVREDAVGRPLDVLRGVRPSMPDADVPMENRGRRGRLTRMARVSVDRVVGEAFEQVGRVVHDLT